MKLLFVILAVVLVSCHGLAYGGEQMGHSRWLRALRGMDLSNFFEGFKEVLRTGNATFGIPILDPFKSEQERIMLNDQLLVLDALLTDLTAVGISTYKVHAADLNIIGIKMTMGLSWEKVSMHTHYAMKGNIADSFTIYGLGLMDVTAHNLSYNGVVGLSMKDGHLYVKSIESKIGLTALDFKATGLFEDNELSELLSALITDMAPQLVEDFHEEVARMVNKVITSTLDKFLANKTLKDLLELLT